MTNTLKIDIDGAIAVLTMNRPDKRNAMNDTLLAELDAFFSAPPEGVKVVVLTGTAGHYCSGLDLSEQVQRDAEGTMRHSRNWHGVMDKIQYSGLPVVSAMFGAVIGGGLELATSTHVRIAEPSTIFHPLKYPLQRRLSQRVSRTAQPNQSQTRLIALQAVSELKPFNEQRKEAAQSPVKYRSLPSQINDTFPTSQPCRREPVEKS